MQTVIDISKEMYQKIKETSRFISGRRSGKRVDYILFNAVNAGTPLNEVLDKIKEEIEQVEINGHISDVECFSAGINVALNVIDKYKVESEE